MCIAVQVSRLKEENCVRDGEVQLLRDNLRQRDAELDAIKHDKIHNIHQQNVQQTEREKHLQVGYLFFTVLF